MPEIPVSSLDVRAQKLVENAQIALQRRNFDYVLEVTGQVLKAAPGCLPVRRLQRVAQMRAAQSKNKLFSKALGSVTQAGFLFGKKAPAEQLENAERMLAADPTSTAGLRLLAEAAVGMGLPETAAFAWECLRDLQPTDRETLLGLAEAYLAAGKARQALATADALLKLRPQDGDGLELMRRASVAQTMEKGRWEEQGSFREKLRDEAASVSREQAAKAVTSEAMTQRLLREALARVQSEPENISHYRAVIDAQRQLGELAAAVEWVRKARALPTGGGDTTLERLETELQVATLEQIVTTLRDRLETTPDDAALVGQLETAQSELNRYRLDQAEAYVDRYPNDYAARFTLAELYFERGDHQQAIANYQQAQKHPQVRLAALAGMGKALKARRMFDLAVAQFQSAKDDLATMDDLKKEIIYELAGCFEAMGETDKAITEYKVIYSKDIGFRDVADKVNAYYASR